MKLILLFLTLGFCACNQNRPGGKTVTEPKESTFNYSVTLEQLEQKIQVVNDSINIYEYNPYARFNLTDYTDSTTQDIVHFINTYPINPDSIKGLKRNVAFDNIEIYSYGFWSGGTRGFITYSILTVNTDNTYLAANLAATIEGRYDSIVKLDHEFYLLLGGDKAYSNTYYSLAYLVKINDTIDLDYPAFVNRPFLNFYNGGYTYEPATKLLKFQGEDHESINEIFTYKEKYRKYANDSLAAKKLYELIIPARYYDTKSFVVKFNGKNFERYDGEDDYEEDSI